MQSVLLNPQRDASQAGARVVPVIGNTLTGRELNEKQRTAVAQATRPLRTLHDCTVTLIQGPPGTGKTHTSVEIVYRWLQVNKQMTT
eukprot:1196251-Prorocentrum_minimum.AAC.5